MNAPPILLDAIKYVSGPLTLVAFLAVCWLVRHQVREFHRRRLVTSADSKDKIRLIERELDRFKKSYSGLSPDLKYDLYKREIKSQDLQFFGELVAIVVVIILAFIAFTSLSIVPYFRSNEWASRASATSVPSSWLESRRVPKGTRFTIKLLGLPPDAKVTWSVPNHGTLNTFSGDAVDYTAESIGNESISANVKSTVFAFEKQIGFEVMSPF